MTLFQKWLMRKSGEARFAAQNNVERSVFACASAIKNNSKMGVVFDQLSESELENLFSRLESSITKAVQE